MLFTRFVFTKVGKEALKRLKDYALNNYWTLECCKGEYFAQLSSDATDEKLYDACCYITEEILMPDIVKSLKKSLIKSCGSMNLDEFEHICNVAFKKDYIAEIPGRMYVYVKMNHEVNPLGFYTFMCRDIDKSLIDASVEEVSNLLEFNEKQDMIETLRCFSDMSLESVNKVVIFANSHGLEIRECFPPRKDFESEFSLSESDVLADLVTLNPRCIEIHGKEEFLKNDISSVIEGVFGNRIEYR